MQHRIWFSNHVEIYLGGNKCIDCLNTWNYDFMTHDKCIGCHLPVTCKICMREPKSFLKQEMLRGTLLGIDNMCQDLWVSIMTISPLDTCNDSYQSLIYFYNNITKSISLKPNHFTNYSLEPCWGCSECTPKKDENIIIKKPKLQKPNLKNQNIKRQNQICMKNMKRKFF